MTQIVSAPRNLLNQQCSPPLSRQTPNAFHESLRVCVALRADLSNIVPPYIGIMYGKVSALL